MAVLPNSITALRIVGTLLLMFTKNFSPTFFVIYTIAGLSDVLDGYIARKTNTQSAFGAKLDSVADIIFYLVMIIKILPSIIKKMSVGMWYSIGLIIVLRVVSYIIALIKFGCFSSLHSVLNKLTGFCVFSIPYVIFLPIANVLLYVIIGVAIISTVDEITIHLKSKEHCSNTKSFIETLKSK